MRAIIQAKHGCLDAPRRCSKSSMLAYQDFGPFSVGFPRLRPEALPSLGCLWRLDEDWAGFAGGLSGPFPVGSFDGALVCWRRPDLPCLLGST